MAELKNRDEIRPEFKWNLEDIIDGTEKWEEIFKNTDSRKDICLKYKGKLRDRKMLLDCLIDETSLTRELDKLYVYAKMKSDEDTAASLYKGLVDRVEMLFVQISSNNSYIVPEITAMEKEEIIKISKLPEFSDYSYSLAEIARNKDHILSEIEEKILAETSLFSSSFHETFNVLNNADIKFGRIKNEEGKSVAISHGSYSVYLQSSDRQVRKNAFREYYKGYIGLINTIASNYGGNVKKNCFYAKVRKFDSALAASMNRENVDKAVYETLLDSVSKNVSYVHQYVKVRKKTLGLNKIHMYDMYVPIIEDAEIKLTYSEAYELVLKALAPLGKEYIDKMKEAYKSGWIDVYETKNKRSGAYSWGVYDAHPYVLLNYQKTTHDVFTIAHEMGHAMHTHYSNKTQPLTKASYEIFVAEVASTVNELLLLRYLMKTEDNNLKKYLLTYLLDTFRTTLFRQTMFAEFEMKAHQMVESGKPLTTDSLNELYYDLNVKYYGKEVSDQDIKYEWARIPHFYTAFYVYKYATGLTSACTIVDKILTEEGYVNKYYDFLKAGGSMPPVEILKLADVDLMTREPYDSAMTLFKNTLEELETLL